MTEEQAIERIVAALMDVRFDTLDGGKKDCQIFAKAAWNEMKAIAMEDATLPFTPGR